MQRYAKYLGLILAVFILSYINLKSEVPMDRGDGLMHYFFANAAWQKPIYFFEHWAKPLFTLFSSPFAQFGYKGHIFFNIVVFIITQLLCFRVFKSFEIHTLAYWICPFFFLAIPDYFNGIIGGMTEPLFGCLLLAAMVFLLEKKFLVSAVIISFLPFARSEGMLALALFPIAFILLKQWKYLPFFITGMLIYSVAGWLMGKSLDWYFTENPYPPISPYGKGPWDAYLASFNSHFNKFYILLLPIAFYGFWKNLKSYENKKLYFTSFFFAVSIYLGIIVAHSYFWYKGINGSMGLSRIATQGLPVMLLFILLHLALVAKKTNLTIPGLSGLAILVLFSFYPRVTILRMQAQDVHFEMIARYVNKHKQHRRVFYFHASLAFFWKTNAQIPQDGYQHIFMHLPESFGFMKKGDIIVRDSDFGPNEMGLSMETLAKFPELKLVRTFATHTNALNYYGEYPYTRIYQYLPNDTLLPVQAPIIKNISKTRNIVSKDKHLSFIEYLKIPNDNNLHRIQLEFSNIDPENTDLYFYCTGENNTSYSQKLENAARKIVIDLPFNFGRGNIFILNPSKKRYSLKIKSLQHIIIPQGRFR